MLSNLKNQKFNKNNNIEKYISNILYYYAHRNQ